jgi:hypothetical protein
MICCVPFTYLSEANLHLLHRLSEHLVVHQPSANPVSGHMNLWVEKGAVTLRWPGNIDGARIRQAAGEFKAWADLHHGDIADIAGFYKSSNGRPPLVNETDPTQIGTQLRRFGRPSAENDEDYLFQACLFLSLAHDYDAQRDMLAQALQSVEKNEQEMFHGLAGDPDEHGDALKIAGTALKKKTEDEPGTYMTDRRVQAWATVACHIPETSWAYITTSRAVFDSLSDRFPGAIVLPPWTIGTSDHPKLNTLFKGLAFEENLASTMEKCAGMGGGPGSDAQLTLCVLADRSPQNAFSELSSKRAAVSSSTSNHAPVNTVFGYIGQRKN